MKPLGERDDPLFIKRTIQTEAILGRRYIREDTSIPLNSLFLTFFSGCLPNQSRTQLTQRPVNVHSSQPSVTNAGYRRVKSGFRGTNGRYPMNTEQMVKP